MAYLFLVRQHCSQALVKRQPLRYSKRPQDVAEGPVGRTCPLPSRHSLGAQFIIEADLPGLVFRTPPPPNTPPLPNGQPDRGPVTLVIDPNENLSGAIFEGLDYEAIYILDSSIFGHGDFGRLTFTVTGTW